VVRRLLLPLLALISFACSTSTEPLETTPLKQGPTRLPLEFRIEAPTRCDPQGSRALALQPRGEPLLLLQVTGPLASDGSAQPFGASLRPPGVCGSLPLCGHFLVSIDPGSEDTFSFRVSSRAFEVPLASLASPFGPHTIEVRLLDDAGEPAVGADGTPLAQVLQIETLPESDGCGG
jgi:hypothetical protein